MCTEVEKSINQGAYCRVCKHAVSSMHARSTVCVQNISNKVMDLSRKIFGYEQILTEKRTEGTINLLDNLAKHRRLMLLTCLSLVLQISLRKRAAGNFIQNSDFEMSFTDKNSRNSS